MVTTMIQTGSMVLHPAAASAEVAAASCLRGALMAAAATSAATAEAQAAAAVHSRQAATNSSSGAQGPRQVLVTAVLAAPQPAPPQALVALLLPLLLPLLPIPLGSVPVELAGQQHPSHLQQQQAQQPLGPPAAAVRRPKPLCAPPQNLIMGTLGKGRSTVRRLRGGGGAHRALAAVVAGRAAAAGEVGLLQLALHLNRLLLLLIRRWRVSTLQQERASTR